MEGYMAVVTPWAANFAPLGWQFCAGQQMSIAQNSALFALIGTIYGGDGQTTFNLPDLRSRVAIGAGTALTGTNYVLGQKAGTEANTITMAQMAAHTHPFMVTSQVPVNNDGGASKNPQGAFPAPATGNSYNTSGSGEFYGNFTVSAQTATVGGSIPVSNISPVTCLNYIICVEGIFPSRP